MSNLIKLLSKTPCNALLEEILTDLEYNDAEQEVLSEVLTWLYMNGRLKLVKEVEEKDSSAFSKIKPHDLRY